MAVTLTLGKQLQQPETTEVPQDLQTGDPRVDELFELLAWADKQKKDPRTVRLAELNKQFGEEANSDDHDGEEAVVFEGTKARYEFGKKENTRSVTPEGLSKFADHIGEEAFLEVASVPLSAIDKYIPKVDQDDYLEYGTGNRSGKMVPKIVAKPAKK